MEKNFDKNLGEANSSVIVSEAPIDNVNHPKHYMAANGIETIDVIEGFTDPIVWNNGNVIKYICRWQNKNGLEDLKKAQFYLNRLIGLVEEKNRKEDLK